MKSRFIAVHNVGLSNYFQLKWDWPIQRSKASAAQAVRRPLHQTEDDALCYYVATFIIRQPADMDVVVELNANLDELETSSVVWFDLDYLRAK
jgi:hypothetical protein